LAWPEITETFIALSKQTSPELPEDIMDKLERCIVFLYSRTSDDKSVNSARLSLFCQMSRPIDNIPPTRAALEEHTRRSIYQGGLIRWHCLEVSGRCDCIWLRMGGEWFQIQAKMDNATLPTAKKACLELISCKCMKRAWGTVNVTERSLHCLVPMSQHVLCRLIYLTGTYWLTYWITGSPRLTLLCSGQNLQRKACSV